MKKIFILLLALNCTYANLTVLGDSFPPFSYVEDGIRKGMATEMVDQILNNTDIRIKKHIIILWKDALEYTMNNPNALLYTIVRNSKREDLFHWVGPLSDRKMYLYKDKSRKDIIINSWEDAAKHPVISLKKATVTDYIASRGVKTIDADNLTMAYKMFTRKRAPLLAMLDYSFKYLNANNDNYIKAFEIDQPGQYYLVLSKETPIEIVNKVRASFEALNKKGVLKKIRQKYL